MTRSIVVAVLLACQAFAADTPPVALCDSGLSPGVRVQRYDGDGWSEIATDATVIEIGGGMYSVSGLPVAAGVDQFMVLVTVEGDPSRVLATYGYGAVPGTRIAWRNDLDLGRVPVVLRAGDTFGSIELRVRSGLPATIVGATATAALRDPASGLPIFEGRQAQVANVEMDAKSGTYSASLIYDVAPGDLNTSGEFRADFTVCYAAGECHTLPADHSLRVRVVEKQP